MNLNCLVLLCMQINATKAPVFCKCRHKTICLIELQSKKERFYKKLFIFLQLDNVNSCLNILRTHSVGGLESITTNDICSGRLKAVLALFFALSRYKQASKQKSTTIATAPTVASGACGTPTKQQIYQQQIQQPVGLNVAQDMTNRWVQNDICFLFAASFIFVKTIWKENCRWKENAVNYKLLSYLVCY